MCIYTGMTTGKSNDTNNSVCLGNYRPDITALVDWV